MEPNDPQNTDAEIMCARCYQSFIWTAGEQQFYFDRGLAQPKYCKECREARKHEYATRQPNEN